MDLQKVSVFKRDADEAPRFHCPECTCKDSVMRRKMIVCVRCGAEFKRMADGELVCFSRQSESSRGSGRRLLRTGSPL